MVTVKRSLVRVEDEYNVEEATHYPTSRIASPSARNLLFFLWWRMEDNS
jgi:hypothetical protein